MNVNFVGHLKMLSHLCRIIVLWFPLNVPAMKIYREEAVGLKSSNYTLKITIFVNVWDFGQFLENLIFSQ